MHTSLLRDFRAMTASLFAGKRAVLLSVLGMVILTTLSSTFPTAVAADKAQQKEQLGLSKNVMPLVKAANDAISAKQYDVALQKLQEAEAVDKKTPYDQFRIEEFRALVYIQENTRLDEVLNIYERHLSTPEYLEPQLSENRLKALTQVAFRAQAYDKVIKYGNEWLASHANDTTVIDLVARAYYINKDYKNALDTTNKLVGIVEAAGEVPQEISLQLISSCASQLNDAQSTFDGYQKLVRYYPKPENWTKVLEITLSVEKNDLAILNVLRLMADTGVLNKSDYYYEYSQRAIENALPGEAQKVLETGFEKKIIGTTDADKGRYQHGLSEAKQKAQADRAQLPQLEKELAASKSTTGQAAAGLGLAYFSFQMYDKAIEDLEAGIAKGGLKNVDNYRMALGMSYLRAGQKDKAREQFKAAAANPQLVRVAALWTARTYN